MSNICGTVKASYQLLLVSVLIDFSAFEICTEAECFLVDASNSEGILIFCFVLFCGRKLINQDNFFSSCCKNQIGLFISDMIPKVLTVYLELL